MTSEIRHLRRSIIRALRQQGYTVQEDSILMPEDQSKEALRRIHEIAVKHNVALAAPALRRHEDRLLGFIANGSEIDPHKVHPRLVLVERGSFNELLFRYAALHWSI